MKAPPLIKEFENIFWVHTPGSWKLQSSYSRGELTIKIKHKNKTISRKYHISILKQRRDDLWGLARDCVEEAKKEVED